MQVCWNLQLKDLYVTILKIMPFKSKAQQGYMFVNFPNMAKKWAKKTTKKQYKALPKKVKKTKASKKRR
jgi:hypothetical protein